MTRRNFLPLALWLATLGAAAALAAGARYTADLSGFLPRSPNPAQQLLVEQLRDGAVGRLMLVAIEGADAARRADLSRALAAALGADPRFAYVANGASSGAERERALLLEHRYRLSPAVSARRFSEPGLREAIGETLDLVASSAGALAQALLARDPTGEFSRLVSQQIESASRPAIAGGVWASRDGSRALLVALTAAAGADTEAQAQAAAAVQRAFDAAAARASAPGAQLRLSGPGVFAAQSRALIQGEAMRLGVLGTLLVAALLLAVTRSPVALVLGLLPVLTGALVGVAAVAAGFGVVHGITLGFGATLIGEAVDYAIYQFVQADSSLAAAERYDAWVAEFWPAVRLGVLTSIIGFAALLFSGFPGLAQLGLYSVAGIAAAALVTRYVLPWLLPANLRVRDLSRLGAQCARLVRASGRWRWLVLALAVLAAALLFAKRDSLWAQDLSALNPVSAESQAYDGALRADLGAPDARYLIVARAADEQSALAAAEAIARALEPLVAAGVIAGFDSPSRYLPSRAAQDARIAALPDADTLRARLQTALRGAPLRADRLEAFVRDVQRARGAPPLSRADFAGTAFGLALDSLFLAGPSGWKALLPLRAPAGGPGAYVIDASRVRAALAGSGATFLDLKSEADALYAGYLREAVALSLAGFGTIALLLGFALRSATRAGRVLAPLIATVLVTAGLLAAAGQTFNLLHLVGFLLIVAIGSNYALFFDRGLAHGEPSPRVLASLLLANLTTMVGFGVLATSSLSVLRSLGLTVALGALLALLFAALSSAQRPDRG
jgi:predicted exporter